jgi:uncharacterized protein DUF4112
VAPAILPASPREKRAGRIAGATLHFARVAFGRVLALPLSMPEVLIPEVIEPDEKLPRDLVALRRFAYFMDEAVAIPGTRMRVGLDAAVGLIPGVGDAIGGLLSAWIVIAALRHRLPALKVWRMIVNILLDVTIGAIPLAGDAFDFLFEENVMNLKLLLLHRDRRQPPRTTTQVLGTAAMILGMILLVALGAAAGVIVLIFWLIGKR